MTIIAYRNGIMACDSCWASISTGLIDSLQTKISRLEGGVLYGAAGDADDRVVVETFNKIKRPKQIPSVQKLKKMEADVDALLVFPSGDIYSVLTGEKNAECMRIAREFHATGSGHQLALGAMAMGATAVQAVEVACKYNIQCRPPICTLALVTRRGN